VRAAFAEVVLDVPRGVEPERVGQLDLLERLPVRPLLGLALTVGMRARPRLGDVDLVEQVELHRASLFVRYYKRPIAQTNGTLRVEPPKCQRSARCSVC
jgi:hypothetical protein